MIYTVTVYCGLGPKLGLVVVRKHLASLRIGSSEARWSSSSKNISEVKGYSDWDRNGFFPFGNAGSSEKAMAPHSSTLAWKIPWTEEPGRLQSMGLLRVGHDWETSLSLYINIKYAHLQSRRLTFKFCSFGFIGT